MTSINKMKFIKGWKIDLSKVPTYPLFDKVTFTEELDKGLALQMNDGDYVFPKFYDEDGKDITKFFYADESRELWDSKIVSRFGKTNNLRVSYKASNGYGRRYSINKSSVLDHPRVLKHTIMKSMGWRDADLSKAHPTIVASWGILNEERLFAIEEYVATPERAFGDMLDHFNQGVSPEDFIDSDDCKSFFNIALYGGSLQTWLDTFAVPDRLGVLAKKTPITNTPTPFMVRYLDDCLTAMSNLKHCNPDIEAILASNKVKGKDFQKKSEFGKAKTMTSFCLGIIENHALYGLYKLMVKEGIIKAGHCGLEKDGLCFKPIKDFCEAEFLVKANADTLKITGFPLKWGFKGYDKTADKDLYEDFTPYDPSDDILDVADTVGVLTLDIIKHGTHDITKACYPLMDKLIISRDDWYQCLKSNLWIITKSPQSYVAKIILAEIEKVWFQCKGLVSQAVTKDEVAEANANARCCQMAYLGVSASMSVTLKYLAGWLCDTEFYKKIDYNSGLLAFENGIYDMRTGDFRGKITPADFVTFTVPSEFSHTFGCESFRDTFVWKQFKKVLNNNDTHLDYWFSLIGASMSGEANLLKCSYFMIDGSLESKGDNGKTFLFNLLGSCFGKYVHKGCSDVLVEGCCKAHKYLDSFAGKRLIWLEECPKKKLNADLFKQLSEGAEIEYEKMFGTTSFLTLMAKLFICSNHTPQLEGDAPANRLKQISFGSHFCRNGDVVEDNADDLKFVANPLLTQEIVDFHSADLIAIVLHYAQRYYSEGIPPTPKEFVDAEKDTKTANDPFQIWFEDNVETDVDRCLSCDAVVAMTGMDKKTIRAGMKKKGFVYDDQMTGMGKSGSGKQNRGGWNRCGFYKRDEGGDTGLSRGVPL
jgi:phage/plasmid-associated DNA primase